MTWLAHPYVKLETHDGDGQSGRRAPVAHSLTTVSAVMLSQAKLSLVHHGTDVPEEGSTAQLTCVRLDPFRRLLTLFVHIPEHNHTVLTRTHQLSTATQVAQR